MDSRCPARIVFRATGGKSGPNYICTAMQPCFGLAKADAWKHMPSSVFPPAASFAGYRRAIYLAALLAGLGSRPTLLAADQPAASPGVSGYHLEARWKPGDDGGWDYLTLDSQANRLYVARTDCVQIIDLGTGRLIRAIPGFEGGHGITLASELNDGFATSGESGTLVRFNLTSLRPYGAPITVGKKPDAVVYEPLTRHVFVFNGGSNDASVVDAATGAVVTTLPLGGVPEFAVTDDQGTVFVNLNDKNEVLALDPRSNTITHRWPLAPGTGPTGLALDPIKHRLFAGCRDGRMIVLDAQNGRRLADLPIGKNVDACAFDPGTGFAFASCGDGTLTVVQENPARPGDFRVVETVKTQRGARTMALDPKTHNIYLATADFATVPASGEKPSRPEVVPGSFVLLEFTR